MGELSRVMRVVRTLLLASTSLGLATIAHGMGDGMLPGPGTTTVLGVLAISASCLVAGARPRVWVLIPFLTVMQLCLHQALTWAGSAAVVGTGGVAHPGHAGHAAGHAAAAATSHAAASDATTSGVASHATDPRMFALHCAAILATALLIVIGDRTAQAALDVFGQVIPALAVPSRPPVDRPRAHPVTRALPAPYSVRVARATPRRGPPAAFA